MLVSDPTTDKSSGALDVHIGYMVDDQDLPGLAHFCEHMRKWIVFLLPAKPWKPSGQQMRNGWYFVVKS